MALPKTVTITKNGVELHNNVDKANYLLVQLARAAMNDVGKLLRKRIVSEIKMLPGMKKSKRPYSAWYKVPFAAEGMPECIIGVRSSQWYAMKQELGSDGMPKKGIIRETTMANIDQIRLIQGQYLSAIEEENRALGLINEEEMEASEGDA